MNQSSLKPDTIAILGVPKPLPAPGRKTAADPIWICVADGIWKNTRAKQPWLYERPVINGHGTFKALGTTLLKKAKLELARRLTRRFSGEEPPPRVQERVVASVDATSGIVTTGDIIRACQRAGYPDKRLNPRLAETQKMNPTIVGCSYNFGTTSRWTNAVIRTAMIIETGESGN